ncbi:MAG TPA: hypothetical protein VGQ02_08995 [Candidatus Limnocylindrales bacterium]|nr:hypothetical protein [Candidatus Limnocylindrales bacterium]
MVSSGGPSEHSLRAFMDGYCEAWNREDLEAIVAAYHVPSFTYKEGTLHAFLDAESRREYIAEFIELNRKEGPATWEILSFTVADLGRNSALVTSRWVFRQTDGSVVWDFVDSHHLCRFDGRWQFLVRTLHD